MQRRNSVGKFLKDKFQNLTEDSFNANIDPEIYGNRYVFEVAWEVVNKGNNQFLSISRLYF